MDQAGQPESAPELPKQFDEIQIEKAPEIIELEDNLEGTGYKSAPTVLDKADTEDVKLIPSQNVEEQSNEDAGSAED